MGQYFKPVFIAERKQFSSWDFGNGSKFLEHCFVGNELTLVIESFIKEEENATSLVWAGDYAPTEKETKENHPYSAIYDLEFLSPEDQNLYDIAKNQFISIRSEMVSYPLMEHRFYYSKTAKEYVDVEQVNFWWDDLKIHPLAFLTSEGLDEESGDYKGPASLDLASSWARHEVFVSNKVYPDYRKINLIFTPYDSQ